MKEEIVDSLIEDIWLLCFMEQPLYEVIYEFKRNGLLFESTKQLNILMPLLVDVYNNTRTWANRGYTAKEISENFIYKNSLLDPPSINMTSAGYWLKTGYAFGKKN